MRTPPAMPRFRVPPLVFAAICVAALALGVGRPLHAQAGGHQHTPGMSHDSAMAAMAAPNVEAGQAAFAAIAEIVRLLEADPGTDWSRVNLDALREHLRDMDRVMMHSRVVRTDVAGGLRMEVTGAGEVAEAIRRMLTAHAPMLESEMPVRAEAQPIAGGVALVVRARDASDTALVQRLRGLGFAGLMARGDHHVRHHMMLARGGAAH